MATPDLCYVQLNIFQIPSTATLNGQTRLRKNLMLHYFVNGKTKPGRRDRTLPDASESDIILLNHYMLLHPLARRLARPGTIPPYLTPPLHADRGERGVREARSIFLPLSHRAKLERSTWRILSMSKLSAWVWRHRQPWEKGGWHFLLRPSIVPVPRCLFARARSIKAQLTDYA